MTVERLRAFVADALKAGLLQRQLTLPAPKTLLLPAPEDSNSEKFSAIIEHGELVAATRDLFGSGHYNIAVQEAFKILDHSIRAKTGHKRKSGTSLINHVFSPASPELVWSERSSTSEVDHHEGYHKIFLGSVQGIRNPCTHEIQWIDDAEEALDLLTICQHLLRKVEQSRQA